MAIKTIIKQTNDQAYRFHISQYVINILRRLDETPNIELPNVRWPLLWDLTETHKLVEIEYIPDDSRDGRHPVYSLSKFGDFILALADERVYLTVETGANQ